MRIRKRVQFESEERSNQPFAQETSSEIVIWNRLEGAEKKAVDQGNHDLLTEKEELCVNNQSECGDTDGTFTNAEQHLAALLSQIENP